MTTLATEWEGVEPTTIETINERPAIRLPGDNHLLSEFALNLGRLVRDHGIYA